MTSRASSVESGRDQVGAGQAPAGVDRQFRVRLRIVEKVARARKTQRPFCRSRGSYAWASWRRLVPAPSGSDWNDREHPVAFGPNLEDERPSGDPGGTLDGSDVVDEQVAAVA